MVTELRVHSHPAMDRWETGGPERERLAQGPHSRHRARSGTPASQAPLFIRLSCGQAACKGKCLLSKHYNPIIQKMGAPCAQLKKREVSGPRCSSGLQGPEFALQALMALRSGLPAKVSSRGAAQHPWLAEPGHTPQAYTPPHSGHKGAAVITEFLPRNSIPG